MSQSAHEIDYELFGEDMQYVEIELDPGESAIAEAGAMMYKPATVEMKAIFGDGSGQSGGFMDKLLGAGKRVLTGGKPLHDGLHAHRGRQGARCLCRALSGHDLADRPDPIWRPAHLPAR